MIQLWIAPIYLDFSLLQPLEYRPSDIVGFITRVIFSLCGVDSIIGITLPWSLFWAQQQYHKKDAYPPHLCLHAKIDGCRLISRHRTGSGLSDLELNPTPNREQTPLGK